MAYTAPSTWVAGNVLTAAQLNQQLRDNLLAAFPLGVDAWAAWTPTLTQSGAVAVTVTRGRYQRIGRTIHAQCLLTCTGTGTAANLVLVGSLPAPVANNGANIIVGHGKILDLSGPNLNYKGLVETNGAGTSVYLIGANDTSGAGLGVAGFTAALAAGDLVVLNLTYEATT
jgi:hypothetical protein